MYINIVRVVVRRETRSGGRDDVTDGDRRVFEKTNIVRRDRVFGRGRDLGALGRIFLSTRASPYGPSRALFYNTYARGSQRRRRVVRDAYNINIRLVANDSPRRPRPRFRFRVFSAYRFFHPPRRSRGGRFFDQSPRRPPRRTRVRVTAICVHARPNNYVHDARVRCATSRRRGASPHHRRRLHAQNHVFARGRETIKFAMPSSSRRNTVGSRCASGISFAPVKRGRINWTIKKIWPVSANVYTAPSDNRKSEIPPIRHNTKRNIAFVVGLCRYEVALSSIKTVATIIVTVYHCFCYRHRRTHTHRAGRRYIMCCCARRYNTSTKNHAFTVAVNHAT